MVVRTDDLTSSSSSQSTPLAPAGPGRAGHPAPRRGVRGRHAHEEYVPVSVFFKKNICSFLNSFFFQKVNFF